MSNAGFNNYRNGRSSASVAVHGAIDLDTDTIRAFIIDTADHTVDLANDVDYADITAAAIVAFGTVAGKTVGTVATGVFNHDDLTLADVTGDTVEELLYCKHSGTDSTSPVICRFDTFAGGMPLTPNGGPVDIQPNPSGVLIG